MNSLSIQTHQTMSMSSTEIATLTGKEKSNVHRDIQAQILKGLYEIDDSNLNHVEIQGVAIVLDNRGYVSEYHLDKEHSLTLITGYDVKMRHVINKRWLELEQQATQPKPLSSAEMFLAQAQLSVELEKRIDATQTEVKQVAAKVEQTASRLDQINVDLRNGVPRGFISRANALKMYSQGLSKDVFEKALTAYEVPTRNYIHYAEGYPTPTFAYQEDRIVTVINHFIRELVQETKCQCYSKLLNKRVNYKKPVPNALKEGGAATGGTAHA
jgi:phage regulator Rha-like protein